LSLSYSGTSAHFQYNPSLEPILKQLNSVDVFTPSFFENHFSNISSFKLRPRFIFSQQNFVCSPSAVSCVLHVPPIPCSLILLSHRCLMKSTSYEDVSSSISGSDAEPCSRTHTSHEEGRDYTSATFESQQNLFPNSN
jgi:hypothetical protein